MGSVSDYEVMAEAVAMLEAFGVDFEKRVVSAHRTPDLLCEYAKTARERGIGVIIAGALPLLAVPCILEEFVPFDSEASIVMVADGERVVSFPVGRNVHRDGILDLCIVPAEVDSGVLARMKAQSERFMRDCGYRGILAIEYFIKGGEIYFNEMAPRPHNSGHYTIEGATTNQFRELVRYLVGEPLQEPQPVAPTVMKNILGQDLEAAERIAAENLPGVYVHLYGKTENRPKRKMGHITFVGMDAARFEAEWAGRFVK